MKKVKKVRDFISVDNQWFRRDIREQDHMTFAIYLLILLRKGYDGVAYFTIGHICQMLKIKSNSTLSIKNIKESLIILEQLGYLLYKQSPMEDEKLEISNAIKINDRIYATSKECKKFTIVYADEIYNVIKSIEDHREMRGVLVYLCCILSHINNETKVCFPSIATLRKESKVSNDSTCITSV